MGASLCFRDKRGGSICFGKNDGAHSRNRKRFRSMRLIVIDRSLLFKRCRQQLAYVDGGFTAKTVIKNGKKRQAGYRKRVQTKRPKKRSKS